MDYWPIAPIPVFFATNRIMQGDAANPRFTSAHTEDDSFHFGSATLVPPHDWLPVGDGDPKDLLDHWDSKWRRSAIAVVPQPAANVPQARALLEASAILEPLRAALADSGSDVVILIHGFASQFDLALARAAEIGVRYSSHQEKPLTVLLFSWSSAGITSLLNYKYDRDEAKRARNAIANLINTVTGYRDEHNGARLHLVAHSMGNYALRHAVQRLVEPNAMPFPDQTFANVFLMAADEDWDTLDRDDKLKPLIAKARAVQVYKADKDFPLHVSDVLHMDRLGDKGPRHPEQLPASVHVVDCTSVCSTAVVSQGWHQYYRARPEVYRDVRAVLCQTPLPGTRTIIPA
jgi:esterase/lipase superfamily enzyme